MLRLRMLLGVLLRWWWCRNVSSKRPRRSSMLLKHKSILLCIRIRRCWLWLWLLSPLCIRRRWRGRLVPKRKCARLWGSRRRRRRRLQSPLTDRKRRIRPLHTRPFSPSLSYRTTPISTITTSIPISRSRSRRRRRRVLFSVGRRRRRLLRLPSRREYPFRHDKISEVRYRVDSVQIAFSRFGKVGICVIRED